MCGYYDGFGPWVVAFAVSWDFRIPLSLSPPLSAGAVFVIKAMFGLWNKEMKRKEKKIKKNSFSLFDWKRKRK